MIETINQIAQSWWSWMGSMLWQVSLLIVIITAIDILIRRWVWPQVRYALWLLVLIKLLIPPPGLFRAAWSPSFSPWPRFSSSSDWAHLLSRGLKKRAVRLLSLGSRPLFLWTRIEHYPLSNPQVWHPYRDQPLPLLKELRP